MCGLQEDTFELNAIELGTLKKLKIRHDNKGGGGAWFLSHVEVEDPTSNDTYAHKNTSRHNFVSTSLHWVSC